MNNQRPEVKVVVAEPAPVKPAPPLAFQVALVSVAVFAGPVVLALVVGFVALCAWMCGAVMSMVKQGVGG